MPQIQHSEICEWKENNSTKVYLILYRLNLQVLPNYHGKSNKSLNQSLMEVY